MKSTRKPLAILLSALMLISMFSAAFSVFAADPPTATISSMWKEYYQYNQFECPLEEIRSIKFCYTPPEGYVSAGVNMYGYESNDILFYAESSSNGRDVAIVCPIQICAYPDFSTMFSDLTALTTIEFENLDVSNIVSLGGTFDNCSNLVNVDFSEWNLPNLEYVYRTFAGCSSLKKLDLSTWSFVNLYSLEYTFSGCSSLEEIVLPEEAPRIEESASFAMDNTFEGCSSLEKIDFPNWKYFTPTRLCYTFADCESLKEVDLSGFDTQYAWCENVFTNCNSLRKVAAPKNVPGWVPFDLPNSFDCFYGEAGTLVIENASNVTFDQYRCSDDEGKAVYYTYFTVNPNVTNVTTDKDDLEEPETREWGDGLGDYEITFTPNEGCALPEEISVHIGERDAQPGVDYTYNSATGKLVIPEEKINGDISFEVHGTSHEHYYDDVVVTPPTCTEEGYTTHTCACGETKTTDIVPALNHLWSAWTPVDGSLHTRSCERDNCEATETADHSFDEGVVTEPTCTEEGFTTYTCADCGYRYTDNQTPANGHSYGEVSYDWSTDLSSCTATRTCAENDDTQTETVATTSEVTTQRTCLGQEITTYTATFTNPAFGTITETAPTEDPMGHSYPEAWETDGTYHWHVCENGCGIDGDKAEHQEETIPGVPATCIEAGLTDGKRCSVCGEILVEQEIIPVSTIHTEETIPAVAATCTEAGLSEGTKCSVCGEILVPQAEVEPLGHSNETIPAVPATCTEAGLTEGTKCHRCGVTLVAQEPTPALDHAYGEWTEVTAPTCTEMGQDKRICQNDATHVEYRNVDPLDHVEETIPAVAPTCTETGLTEGTKCSLCGETLVAQQTVPALNHAYGEWTEVTAPTCTEMGQDKRICANDANHVEYRNVDALGHTDETIPAVAPTCTEAGLSEGIKCSVCGVTLVPQVEVEPLGHSNEPIPAVPATCTETGLTEGTKCSLCGVTLVAQEPTPALDHAYGEWTQVTAPTCTEMGQDKRICQNDATHVEYRDVDSLGHVEETIPAVAPTCTETGLTEGIKCSLCGEILVAPEVVSALGHSFGEWTVTQEATTTVEGSKEHTCDLCGCVETEVIPVVVVAEGTRAILFVTLDNMEYVVKTGNTQKRIYSSSLVTVPANEDVTFRVTAFTSFGHSAIKVMANSEEIPANPDGSYTIPVGSPAFVMIIVEPADIVIPGETPKTGWELLKEFISRIIAMIISWFKGE